MAPSAITTIEESYATLSLKPCDNLITNFEVQKTSQNGPRLSRQLIGDALKKRVENIDEDTCEPGEEDAFFVADMGDVYRQHQRWKKHLKRVKPHYGMFTTISCYGTGHFLIALQLSSATLIQRCSVFLQASAQVSIAPPRQRLNKSCEWACHHPASSMRSHARPSRSSVTQLKRASAR